jgi:HD-GYP domain-containing protein (c-di-GMP phosphodiesterase class II)
MNNTQPSEISMQPGFGMFMSDQTGNVAMGEYPAPDDSFNCRLGGQDFDPSTGNPTILEMMYCLSNAMDAMSPAVGAHHKRTALIARAIGKEAGLDSQELLGLLLGGMAHDCGAFSLAAKLETLKFDYDLSDPHSHAEVGYSFLHELENLFPELKPLQLANIVRHHHVAWDQGRGTTFRGNPVPMSSHILHLADRVEVLLKRDECSLNQSQAIYKKITEHAGTLFAPQLVEAFSELAGRESFWLDLNFEDDFIREMTKEDKSCSLICLDLCGQVKLSRLFGHLVDFRSPFTARHSSGVALVAQILARICGFDDHDQISMAVAGYLHDLGKLAVPPELLEKPAALTWSEFNVIKTHPYQTYRLLAPIKAFKKVAIWASEHHEAMDGSGYPFHRRKEDLELGSRILAVADVFTALTEDRPYRAGMTTDQTMAILRTMAGDGKLDPDLVAIVESNLALVEEHRLEGQKQGYMSYQGLRAG